MYILVVCHVGLARLDDMRDFSTLVDQTTDYTTLSLVIFTSCNDTVRIHGPTVSSTVQ